MSDINWQCINDEFHVLMFPGGSVHAWRCRNSFGDERIALRCVPTGTPSEGESICGGTLYRVDDETWRKDAERWVMRYLGRAEDKTTRRMAEATRFA